MTGPLLDSKLSIPRRRGGILRPRLHKRLSRSVESRLTLVSAPAGFGKTTLLASWLGGQSDPSLSVGWLSLDERDNDPGFFWSYLVTAISRASDGAGTDALSLLHSAQPLTEPLLATLLNDMQSIPGDLVLVLDDYHVIETPEIHDAVAFLLEHLPPQIHAIIAGRTDPPLPLARLRARGELIEIRAKDLRFTDEEAATYLNDSMGLSLTAGEVTALEDRTEGWIAALQLAAISLQDRNDAAAFIAGFAGDDRYIVDYLMEEVLQRQPEHVQRFLLQTSILDRLSGPLVDAVTAQENGKSTLVELERANLFLVPLDDRRQWFRYHQLFADVLQARLLDERGQELSDLHRRASMWYDENNEPHEAIRHALAAQDIARAADLIELAVPAIRRNRQEAVLQSWLKLLPHEVVRVRPVLAVELAGALLVSGETEGVEERLNDVESWLNPSTNATAQDHIPSTELIVRDKDEFRKLPGTVAIYRAALALSRGDGQGTVTHARRALRQAPADDQVGRAAAHGLIGLAYWAAADLEAAYQAYSECSEGLRSAGFIADTFGCAIAMADIRVTQGRLAESMRIYEQALKLAPPAQGLFLRGTADMYVGMSGIHRERSDLQAASRLLKQSQDLGPMVGLPQNPYRWRVAMAGISEAQGDFGGALELFSEAERLYVSDYFPNVRPVPAMKVRIWVKLGRLAEARDWSLKQALTPDDEPSYLREFEHVTLARVLLAEYSTENSLESLRGAVRLLGRLHEAAKAGGRAGSAIEILILQARAMQLSGEPDAALASLSDAVALAEPENYVQIFADKGVKLASLLKAAVRRDGASRYLRRLLAAAESGSTGAPANDGLIEPLSDRELDVLRMLGTDLSGPAIARELTVSLNTVRTHTSRIYAKLGVNSRRAAVRQARKLNLLP